MACPTSVPLSLTLQQVAELSQQLGRMGKLAADVEQLKARNVALEVQLAANSSVRPLGSLPASCSSSDYAPCLAVRSSDQYHDRQGTP